MFADMLLRGGDNDLLSQNIKTSMHTQHFHNAEKTLQLQQYIKCLGYCKMEPQVLERE